MTLARVASSTFSSNLAESNGGAIVIDDNEATDTAISITSSTFLNNAAEGGKGGAIFVSSRNVKLSISDTLLLKNSAAIKGGGIHFSGKTLRIDSSTLTGNTAGFPVCQTKCYGGAIFLHGGQSTIVSSVMIANKAGSSGGVVGVQALFQLSSSCLVDNTAKSSGGAIWIAGVRDIPGGAEATIEYSLIGVNGEPWIDVYEGGGLLLSQSNISADARQRKHTPCARADPAIPVQSSEV